MEWRTTESAVHQVLSVVEADSEKFVTHAQPGLSTAMRHFVSKLGNEPIGASVLAESSLHRILSALRDAASVQSSNERRIAILKIARSLADSPSVGGVESSIEVCVRLAKTASQAVERRACETAVSVIKYGAALDALGIGSDDGWVLMYAAVVAHEVLLDGASDHDSEAVGDANIKVVAQRKVSLDDSVVMRIRDAGRRASGRVASAKLNIRVARDRATTADVLAVLAGDDNSEVRAAVAANDKTPLDILRLMVSDEDSGVRWALAQNASADEWILRELAKDDSKHVRGAVAQNRMSPPDLQETLAEDDDDLVRVCVAGGRATPVEVLRRIARTESDVCFMESLAQNEALPVDIMDRLVGHKEAIVRLALAHNRAVPMHVIALLADDESEIVRLAARRNPSVWMPSWLESDDHREAIPAVDS